MITITAPVYDLTTVTAATGRAIEQAQSRRAARSATIDGGCVVYDAGWSACDRTFTVKVPHASREQHDALAYLLRSYQTCVLSCEHGTFEVLLSGLVGDEGTLSVTAEVVEALDG